MPAARRSAPRAWLALAAAAVMLCACSRRKAEGRAVAIDGSSTVFLLSQAVAEELARSGQAQVTVATSGTGGGFERLCRGEVELTGASRPIRAGEAAACEARGVEWIELPVAYDGVVVVVHPGNHWVDHLTVDELRTIWEPAAQGRVTRWSQVRAGFPDRPLRLYGAGVDSGTYDYFTAAVVGKEHSSRGDYAQSEDDNTLVAGVAGDVNALGFFGYAYYGENRDRLKLLAIDGGAGPVAPSPATIVDGSYRPLARPMFLYVARAAADRPEVDRVVSYYLASVTTLAPAVGQVALPAGVAARVEERYRSRRTGSAFAGRSPIGATVEELLAREQEGS